MPNFLNVFIFIAFLGGIILLQIFLSRAESKWPGLIFPGISFLFSIFGVLGMAVYRVQTTLEVIIQTFFAFMYFNIPTAILLAIYFASRGRAKKNKEMDKMNIQDLE